MSFRCWVIGTDTGVGKTYVSHLLLRYFSKQNYSTVAMKPVASGGIKFADKLYNEDALLLSAAASLKLDYDQVNPFCFEPAIAPHIAAVLAGKPLKVDLILASIQQFLLQKADFYLIESVGGWLVPLNQKETMAQLIKQSNIPVILVVGMKLGCLNHALLTVESMKHQEIHLIGWVANQIDKSMLVLNENITTLKTRINAPYLGLIPFNHSS